MNCLSLIIITFFGLAALALLLAANVGTVSYQSVKSSIFLLELSLANLNVDELLPDYGSYSISELGFSSAYIFGMYGYCRGTAGSVTTVDKIWEDIHFQSTNCTSTSTSYSFNPVDFFVDQFNTYNTLDVTIDSSSITLPGGLDTYIKIASNVSRAIYITSIIAICTQVLAIVMEWFCCIVGGGFLTTLVQLISTIAAFISSGCATGEFVYIKNEFNDNFSDFGIEASISTNFMVLTWIGTGVSFLTFLLMTINRCCFSRTSGVQATPQYERIVV